MIWPLSFWLLIWIRLSSISNGINLRTIVLSSTSIQLTLRKKKGFKLILSPNVSSYYIPKFISSIWFCELIYVNFDNIVNFSRILTIREYTFFSEILPFDICLCLSHEFLFSLCIFTNLLGVIKVLNFTLSMSSSDLWRELSQSDSAIVPYQL